MIFKKRIPKFYIVVCTPKDNAEFTFSDKEEYNKLSLEKAKEKLKEIKEKMQNGIVENIDDMFILNWVQ